MVQVVRRIIMNLVLSKLIFIVAEGYNIWNRLSSEDLVRHRRIIDAPETLSIKYLDDNGVQEVIFKRVMNTIPSLLLPIWEVEDDGKVSNQYLIKDLEIVCYHGVNSYSAVALFLHTRTLHGVLDYRFYIDGLPLTNAERPDLVKTFMHPMLNSNISNLPPPNLLRQKRMMKGAGIVNHPRGLCHNKIKKTLYPEILLVVDSPTVMTYVDYGEKIVKYALAYWNAVDMLFSHLKSTEIKINIAGIILGETLAVTEFMYVNSYSDEQNSPVHIMREDALDELGSKFHNDFNKIERDSFDFLIWMTEAALSTPEDWNRGGPDLGFAAPPSACGGTHDEEKRTRIISNRAIIMHDSKYTNYQTAARALASMMFVSIDDARQPDHLSTIMDPSNQQVEGCLRWSHRSEADFLKYSSSSSSCCLLNYPYRTMGQPEPIPPPLTVYEQCQCHQMETHEQGNHNPDICVFPLNCKNQRGELINVGLPLDGTLCYNSENLGRCRNNECFRDPPTQSQADQDLLDDLPL